MSGSSSPLQVGITRPGFGSSGRPINIDVNYFQISSFPTDKIYHYNLVVKGKEDKKLPVRFIMILFKELQKSFIDFFNGNPVAFDGVCNVFSAKLLDFPGGQSQHSFDVVIPEEHNTVQRRPRTQTIVLQQVNVIDASALKAYLDGRGAFNASVQTTIQAINVALRMDPITRHIFNNRAFFDNSTRQEIGGGIEAYRGYFSSVRACANGLMANIDVSSTNVIKGGNLITCVQSFLSMRDPNQLARLTETDRRKVDRILKNSRIVVRYGDSFVKTHVYKSMTFDGADARTFELFERPPQQDSRMEGEEGARPPRPEPGSGRIVTVAEYYRNEKNLRLRYPTLPCIMVSSGIVYPMELVDLIPGQMYRGKLDPDQTRRILEFTSCKPVDRLNRVMDGVRLFNFNASPYVTSLGITVKEQPLVVKARLLNPPQILYHPRSRSVAAQPRFSAWNMRDHMVTKGVRISRWSIAIFVREQQFPRHAAERFAKTFARQCRTIGVEFEHDEAPLLWLNPQGSLGDSLRQAGIAAIGSHQKVRPELICCILPDRGVDLYTGIKAWGNCQTGVATQCMLLKNITKDRGLDQYVANVALKVNVKLGGVNHVLQPDTVPFLSNTNEPAIIFAADVIHPPPGAKNTRPSVASFISSIDIPGSSYFAQTTVQSANTESISDIGGMVTEALKTYNTKTNAKPSRIIYLRDGVSEGQLKDVIETEVAGIRRAYQELEKVLAPKITAVVVTKRHHTRFAPSDTRDADRSGNAPAGTIIDNNITSPSTFDFYLLSHAGLLGTSRPAHYTVISDDNQFTADELQQLMFNLTHVYSRATRSVSIPAPIYYADICCTQARWQFDGNLGDFSDTASMRSSGSNDNAGQDEFEQWKAGFKPIHQNLAKSQYFM